VVMVLLSQSNPPLAAQQRGSRPPCQGVKAKIYSSGK
jgi:hypothetical protein